MANNFTTQKMEIAPSGSANPDVGKLGQFIEKHLTTIIWLAVLFMVAAFVVGAIVSFLLLPNKL